MDLIDALARSEFDRLLGTPESQWLDFKLAPYQLESPRGKWELGKDVAAFANKRGGYIVIGIETQRHENSVEETAVDVRPTAKALVDPNRYRSVIDTWVYPQVRNLQLKWFPPNPSEENGLFVIEVPPQEEDDKFFILRKMVDDAGTESGAIGIPIRDGDRVVWLPAERIHHLIKMGTHPTPGPSVRPGEVHEDLQQRADQRIDQLEEMEDWSQQPTFALQALPPPGAPEQIRDLYEPEGLWGALSRPRGLRSSGFGWRTGVEPEVLNGSLLCRGIDRALWLDADGLLTAATIVNRETLGWAINDRRPPDSPIRINAITLVEMTFEFFRFVRNELTPRLGQGQWTFVVRCRRLRSGRVLLSPGWSDRGLGLEEPRQASSDDWTKRFESEGSPQRDTFLALSRVYGLWGLGESTIPFASEGRVPDEAILSL